MLLNLSIGEYLIWGRVFGWPTTAALVFICGTFVLREARRHRAERELAPGYPSTPGRPGGGGLVAQRRYRYVLGEGVHVAPRAGKGRSGVERGRTACLEEEGRGAGGAVGGVDAGERHARGLLAFQGIASHDRVPARPGDLVEPGAGGAHERLRLAEADTGALAVSQRLPRVQRAA